MSDPFTKEQLDWISNEVRHSANKVLRNWVIGGTIAFVLILIGLIVAFHVDAQHNEESRKAIVNSGRAVSVAGCNRDYDSIQKLRGIIIASRPQLKTYYEEGSLTRAQYLRALDNIQKQLKDYPLPDCRRSLKVLTDDEDATVVIPEPKYQQKKPKPKSGE